MVAPQIESGTSGFEGISEDLSISMPELVWQIDAAQTARSIGFCNDERLGVGVRQNDE
jgi:hypothetical protein